MVKLVAFLGLAAAQVQAYSPEAMADRIEFLPGLDKMPAFNMFSGYVNVGPGKEMFYWFVESQNSPATDPVMLWTNGGPGCSGLSGFLSEQGPFKPTQDGASLFANELSWNKLANMVFIEQPVGVGFSTTDHDIAYGDEQAAEDMHAFIVGFFERFSEHNQSAFYISSESYGGHYMPTLARSLLRRQDVPNFRGVKLGNPITFMEYRTLGEYGTYYGHSLVPKPVWDKWQANECWKNANLDRRVCVETTKEMDSRVLGLDPYALDFPTCVDAGRAAKRASRHQMLRTLKGKDHPSVSGYEPCRSSWGGKYLNRRDVRRAIHVKAGAGTWSECSNKVGSLYNQTDVSEVSMVPVWDWILANSNRDHRYLIFSGDDDSVCATMGTQQFIWDMGFGLKVNYVPWSINDQVAGYRTVWNTKTGAKWSLTTVHGAGHMVPSTQPERSLALLERFLSGEIFQ